METKIKICGITNAEDAAFAVSNGVDFLGLIFADSPRRIDPEQAREIRDAVPDVMLVGVFVNEPLDVVAGTAQACGLNFIQLHGDESPEYCDELRTITRVPIIKAFRSSDMPDTKRLSSFQTASFFLFDLDKGALERDDLPRLLDEMWEHASERRRQGFRLILAGALDATNVREAIRKTNPYCVDVCRGVEGSTGIKDRDALARFIEEVRK